MKTGTSTYIMASNGMGTAPHTTDGRLIAVAPFRGLVPVQGPMSLRKAKRFVAMSPRDYATAAAFEVQLAFPACDWPENFTAQRRQARKDVEQGKTR